MKQGTALTHRINVIAAFMVLNISFSWAQNDPIPVDHSRHSSVTGHMSGKKTVTAPAETAMDRDAMPGMDHSGMDHSKMIHDAMPGMNQNDKAGAAQHSRHDMKHNGHESMSMQGGSDTSEARDPNAYSDGYDFGPLPRPHMGDEELLGSLLVDRLESATNRGSTAMTYDWQAWLGSTYDRAVVRAEGSIDGGTFKEARNELLWAHAITAYWDTQLGVRYDSGQGVDRGWFAFGVQGTAPYWIYVEATAYVNEQGRTSFRLETEYDLLLTQRLILQPRIEVNVYSQKDVSRYVSSGVSDFAGGVRLRYEFWREFAPYVGVEWASKFGSAADNLRATGAVAEGTLFVAGARFWF